MPALGKMLLVLYIFSSPFYLWDSGLPQISDFILLLLICWAASQIASQKLSQHGGSTSFIAEPHFTLLTLFVYYATIVNLFWALISPEKTSFITYTVYLLFNFATMFAFASLYLHYKEDLLKLLYWSLTISLWVQTILTAVSTGTQGLRTTAFFNNPNQLGYYALLTAAILSILHALGRGHPIIQNLSLFACLFISAASLSRATIVGEYTAC